MIDYRPSKFESIREVGLLYWIFLCHEIPNLAQILTFTTFLGLFVSQSFISIITLGLLGMYLGVKDGEHFNNRIKGRSAWDKRIALTEKELSSTWQTYLMLSVLVLNGLIIFLIIPAVKRYLAA
jgi:hypothetical protein